ncbi:hypothetical protein [Rhizobium rhizogenes]|uniref:hypothetical protein n=1 Tax=Rhizobium rhizogenes TaxID=359 RepID=UPI00157473A6|nr:hypothetical protein [Rhizobium rhizogenes]NTF49058.1 hypothetical protein [Rhizobium rhizogenes]NTH06442.1 hypothetical protein [Rhizobium rhizogenes]NTH51576.1 hypothetical protein [Rhizobium rhizogenes]NTH71160.1 hypothetical protein [Rhizobium rhizogenes]
MDEIKPKNAFSPERADLIIRSMRISVVDGTFDVLELMLAHLSPRIELLGNAEKLEQLEQIRAEYAAARTIEQTHGPGCLLNLIDPSVQLKIAKGWIPPNYIANAKNYISTKVNSRIWSYNVSKLGYADQQDHDSVRR